MLIVIFGASQAEQGDMAAALVKARPSRVRHFNLAGQPDAGARMKLLELDTVTRAGLGSITVITGVGSARELAFLRDRAAMVCHLYGPLSAVYHDVRIHDRDVFVSPSVSRMVPAHVLAPDEVLSLCECRHQQRRRLARETA